MRFGRERSVFESSFVGEHFAGIETRVLEEEFASQIFQIPFWCNLCEMLVRLRQSLFIHFAFHGHRESGFEPFAGFVTIHMNIVCRRQP